MWRVRTSERDAIRSWHRASLEELSIYTARGERHSTTDAGTSWTITDLGSAIRSAWEGLDRGVLVVRAARESGGYVLIAASAYEWHAPEGKQLLGSAMLVSTDQGRGFIALATARGPEREIIDACFGPS
jgi:hypothetical protein